MEEKFAGSFTYRHTTKELLTGTTFIERVVPVGSSMTTVVGVNPRRYSLLICNISPNPVSIAFSATYLASGGLVLTAEGGTITLTVGEDGELVSSGVYARARAGETANLYVVEVYGIGETK